MTAMPSRPAGRAAGAPRPWRRRRCRASARRRSAPSAAAPASGPAPPSAGCRRTGWRPAAPAPAMRMPSARRYSSTSASLLAVRDEAEQRGQLAERGDGEVVRIASDRNSACCLRSSGTRPMPCADGVGRASGSRPACPPTRTRPPSRRARRRRWRGPARCARRRPGPRCPESRRGAPPSETSCSTWHAGSVRARRWRCPRPAAPAGRPGRPALDPAPGAEVAADHHADDVVDRDVGHLRAADQAAVAQHGDAVADRHHLVEPVGDEDHADALAAQLADDANSRRPRSS